MEGVVSRINGSFYSGKRVFLTGHTGFKGSWLCLWLNAMGAKVTGYALDPPTDPSLFELCRIGKLVRSIIADVRDRETLAKALRAAKPDIVLHLAAQPLVRDSYRIPVETYATNVMGTVHLLEAVRSCGTVRGVLNVTTDKCYESRDWLWGHRENEPLGGYDPYSSSKACSEMVTSAYRDSFFHAADHSRHGVAVASARSGNVIGGGDWAADRLVPDCVRALLKREPILVRNPHAIRPWQHVLEPLSGYLALARRLYAEGPRFAGAWNFGPPEDDAKPVKWIVERMCAGWGNGARYRVHRGKHPHETRALRLDCTKARSELGWRPRWGLEQAIRSVIEWTRIYQAKGDVRGECLAQIDEYERGAGRVG
ncbi:MAG: CDP-glucose 4,6-dehydratase [candidate division Zixibacteria bacterium RBG_16_53_22]|nr:MAG: CDP-glucose 4,6-dehydratase [candidate division Zixibacteria bacterium RBG_16_53_22]